MSKLFLVENLNRKGGVTQCTQKLYNSFGDSDYYLDECFPNILKKYSFKYLNFLFFPFFILRLVYFIRKNNITTVVCSHFVPIILVFLVKKIFIRKLKVINWIHIELISYFKLKSISAKIYSKIIPFVLKNSNELIVFVSQEAEYKAKKKYSFQKTLTIYNICNELKSNHRPSYNACQLLYIGSFEKRKRLQVIIKALVHCSSAISLNVLGGNPNDPQMMKLVAKLELKNRVKFLGYQKPSTFLRSSSALVIASEVEGFPLVLMEANAFNLPVISTDFNSGIREYLFGEYEPNIISKITKAKRGVIIPNQKTEERLVEFYAEGIDALFSDELKYNQLCSAILNDGGFLSTSETLNIWLDIFNLDSSV